jgi:hypothetical protein
LVILATDVRHLGGTSLTILLEDGRLVNATVSRREKWNTFALCFPDDKGLAFAANFSILLEDVFFFGKLSVKHA